MGNKSDSLFNKAMEKAIKKEAETLEAPALKESRLFKEGINRASAYRLNKESIIDFTRNIDRHDEIDESDDLSIINNKRVKQFKELVEAKASKEDIAAFVEAAGLEIDKTPTT